MRKNKKKAGGTTRKASVIPEEVGPNAFHELMNCVLIHYASCLLTITVTPTPNRNFFFKNDYYCFHLNQPDNLTEEEDILIGEGPTLDRPLTSTDKLNTIIGYALSRRGIR